MGFERFENAGKSFKPKVSIRSNGHMGFTQGAVERFGLRKFAYCVMFYDRAERKVGVEFTNSEQPGITLKVNSRSTDCFVSIRGFLDYYNIDYSVTRSYGGEKQEGSEMIVIDLNSPIAERKPRGT